MRKRGQKSGGGRGYCNEEKKGVKRGIKRDTPREEGKRRCEESEDRELKKGLGPTKPRTNGNTVSEMTEGYREEQKIPRQYEEDREESTSLRRREE